MRRLRIGAIGVFFAYLAYGLLIANYNPLVFPPKLETKRGPAPYDYRGVINVQSVKSSGSGTYAEVIAQAQEAGLDFLVFTDQQQTGRTDAIDGYSGNLLVMTEAKYSFLDSRLLLLDATSLEEFQGPGRAQMLLADRLSRPDREKAQGLLILAHPFRPGYQWSGEIPLGLDGLEVLNLKSIWEGTWVERKWSLVWTLLTYPFNSRLAFLRLLEGAGEREAALWDRLNQTRPRLGLVGADADAKVRLPGQRVYALPSYKELFGIVSNHVLLNSELTGQPKADRDKIFSAIRSGHFYSSVDLLADPTGFLAEIRNEKHQHFPMGTRLTWGKGLSLHVKLSREPVIPYELVFFRNGQRLASLRSQPAILPIDEPGNYRVFVRLLVNLPPPDGRKWLPWIYSNGFFVEPPRR